MASRRHDPPKDERGGHIRLYWELFDSVAWRALSHADRGVWLAMRRRLGKTNNGNIEAVLSEMSHAGIRSSSTLAKALRGLEVLGFISKVRQGKMANGGKECSLYRFCDEPTLEIAKIGVKRGPPSNEWREFRSIAHAQGVLNAAHDAAKRPGHRNASKVRNSKRTDSKIEAENVNTASNFEQLSAAPLRESKQRKAVPIATETAPSLGRTPDRMTEPESHSVASKIEAPCKSPSVVAGKRKSGKPRDSHREFNGPDGSYLLPRAICNDTCTGCDALAGEFHLASCHDEPCPKCGVPRGKKECPCGGRSPIFCGSVRGKRAAGFRVPLPRGSNSSAKGQL